MNCENIAVRHTLPEAQASHRIAMDRLHESCLRPKRVRYPKSRKFRSAIAAFVAIHSKEYNGQTERLMSAWKAKTWLQKADNDQYVRADDESDGEEPDDIVDQDLSFNALAPSQVTFRHWHIVVCA